MIIITPLWIPVARPVLSIFVPEKFTFDFKICELIVGSFRALVSVLLESTPSTVRPIMPNADANGGIYSRGGTPGVCHVCLLAVACHGCQLGLTELTPWGVYIVQVVRSVDLLS